MKNDSTPKEVAFNFILEQQLAVMSAVDNGKPYSSLVYFVADNDFKLYFMTKKSSSKCAILMETGQVGMVIGLEDQPISVNLVGNVELEANSISKSKHFKRLLAVANTSDHWPAIMHMNGSEPVVFKVTPQYGKLYDARDVNGSSEIGKNVFHDLSF